jgi:hypothetical protein
MSYPKPDYESIELTEEEIKAAIYEGKKRKYFHERNKDYWQSIESKKGETCIVIAEK